MAKLRELKPGTLVRFQEWATNEDYGWATINTSTTKNHGHLWLVVGHDENECSLCETGYNNDKVYGTLGHSVLIKSLATGQEVIAFVRELEKADVQEG